MSIPVLAVDARAKINTCLLLGPLRDDGYHEVATVIIPVELADRVVLRPAAGISDEVSCPGVEGDNLASRALALFREQSGWDGAPVRIEISKRIPVAAGMAGGSADAAAALRLVAEVAGGSALEVAASVAPMLGADVPAMLDGRAVLATGTGATLEPLPRPADCGLLVLPAARGLSTPDVFRRAGELGLRRDGAELVEVADRIRSSAVDEGWELPVDLIGANDLGTAAEDLSPAVSGALAEATAAGAESVFVTGSGPTVIGLFRGADGPLRAAAAADALADRIPAAISCSPSPGSGTIEEGQ